jgi:hypothetical protein
MGGRCKLSKFESGREGMNPRICICCGEAIGSSGNVLSRNPNLCASCSSIVDGMEDYSRQPVADALPDSELDSFQESSESVVEKANR